MVIRFALVELLRRWRAGVSLAVLVSLPVFGLMIVDGYTRTSEIRFAAKVPRLVVQQQGTVGLVAGSRIPRAVGDDLRAAGVLDPIPEVHAVTGSTGRDAMIVVGVDPDRYRDLDTYRLLEGEHLRAGAGERTAVLGTYLAARLHVGAGDIVRIRARDVRVVGVFETGLYLDDAALLPLADAQGLLGWGDDVSIFVIPAGGPLAEGDRLDGGLEVTARGDVSLLSDWDPVVRIMLSTVRLLAVGAVLVLAIAVWRLVWLQRAELGVLRLLGFRRAVVAGYVIVQSTLLVVVAVVAGVVAAVFVAPRLAQSTLAVTTEPVVDGTVILRGALVGVAVLAVAVVVPLVVVGRLRVRALLTRDD